jgi:transcriptional regulator with XRE-family HTH domain
VPLRTKRGSILKKPAIAPPHLAPFCARLEIVRRNYGQSLGKRRLPANAFAEAIGLLAPRYRRYERGEIEPTMQVLQRIRQVTGVSLDWLVCDQAPGAAMPGANASPTVGQRLRWARETQEPFDASCAALMSVPTSVWRGYEHDWLALPLETAREFSHRFAVSLEYLFEGRLVGCAPRVLEVLISLHPELLSAEAEYPSKPRGRSRKGKDADSASQSAKPRPSRVVNS